MIPLGHSATDTRNLNAALATHHLMRVRVELLTLSGDPSVELSSRLIDGQVNVDATADVTRSATLSLLDESRTLAIDADAPSDGALYMDRMVRVTYGVVVNGAWVDVPAFTGPITKLDRTGDTINIEAQGKETLGMGAVWRPLMIRKGTPKTSAIRTILSERAGEDSFSIPALASRLPKPLSLGREDVPWAAAMQLARSLNRQLFYDGRGTCRLRTYPGRPVFTFGPGSLLSPLQLSYSASTINTVWVTGGKPKGAKHPVTYAAIAPANHPLSPQALGRNGVPRYLETTIQDDTIRSSAEAKAVGEHALAQGLLEAVDASFDAMPLPHLEPGDMVRAFTDEGAVTFRLSSFSLPLTVGNPMSVGYVRNVSPRRSQHRRAHHR